VISSTGTLQNERAVLTAEQQRRLAEARRSDKPVFIVTPDEAKANETTPATGSKTWVFAATHVRDFAWASSRKFIWDGMNVKQDTVSGGADVLAMSFYPKEAEPLWSAYSTKSIAHTIKVYSRFSFPYPYPTAQSVNGPVGGMEYPMITFNGPRPEKDKDGNLTYTARNKYGLIGVIIHEVGHIYFPMVVNSDERQWTWMDEGINTFLQFVAEQEWEENFPSRRGEPKNIISYMVSSDQVPVMTQSDSILQFGNNGYGKPATAMNILRETVLGREVFDRAFIEYAQRWKFKRPTPYDFFRTMEEASGTDLDWFWRGWFYSTEHVDIALDEVKRGTLKSLEADIEAEAKRKDKADEPLSLTIERNRSIRKAVEEDPSLLDFYNRNDEFSVGESDRKAAAKKIADLEAWEREALSNKSIFYYVTLSNKGGVVMPVLLNVKYASGREELIRIPAEIWRRSPDKVTKMLVTDEEIASIELDPRWETADADRSNNHFPQKIEPSRLELYKEEKQKNLMKNLDMKVEPGSLATSPVLKPAEPVQ
jgi:aminopeptidase N